MNNKTTTNTSTTIKRTSNNSKAANTAKDEPKPAPQPPPKIEINDDDDLQQHFFDDDDQAFIKSIDSLRLALEKACYRKDLVKSLLYFLTIEQQSQAKFEKNLNDINWKKLESFLEQLKKISKNKAHLKSFLEFFLAHGTSKTTSQKSSNDNDEGCSGAKSVTPGEDIYILRVLIRFLLKLLKINWNQLKAKLVNAQEAEKLKSLNSRLFEFQLLMLSSLADLCYYDYLRLQVIEDQINLKDLFDKFADWIRAEFDSYLKYRIDQKHKPFAVPLFQLQQQPSASYPIDLNQTKSFEKFRRIWSKMARLASNICQEKNSSAKFKSIISNDLLSCLSKLVEQSQSQDPIENRLHEPDDDLRNELDFYHSILRLIRYGSDIGDCKSALIHNRIMVHLSRFMYKFNRLGGAVHKDLTTRKLNKKSVELIKDMIKQYLLILDNWPTPICCEFYNQMIEGNTIEHLLCLQQIKNNKNSSKSSTSSIDDDRDSDRQLLFVELNRNSDSGDRKQQNHDDFNYAKFSFSLMFKFCRDYHPCCSEFGRIGGLAKCIYRIESIDIKALYATSSSSRQQRSEHDEFEMLVEMVCLSCKESSNRLRLREQGYLIYLVKLQKTCHDLIASKKSNDDENDTIVLNDSLSSSNVIKSSPSPDSLTHNKLLAALCSFAHDQDSMNILLANGLVDSLLTYINETVVIDKNRRRRLDAKSSSDDGFDETDDLVTETSLSIGELLDSRHVRNPPVCLIDLLVIENFETTNETLNRKRKLEQQQQQPKSKQSRSSNNNNNEPSNINNNLSSPNFYQTSSSSSYNYLLTVDSTSVNVQLSPSNSCCSLSPSMSITTQSPTLSLPSPMAGNSRCNSATSMLYAATGAASNNNNQNYYTPSFSSSFSPSSNGLASPTFLWPAQEPSSTHQIQFSPSIKNGGSDNEEESSSDNENAADQNDDLDDEENEETLLTKQQHESTKQATAASATTTEAVKANTQSQTNNQITSSVSMTMPMMMSPLLSTTSSNSSLFTFQSYSASVSTSTSTAASSAAKRQQSIVSLFLNQNSNSSQQSLSSKSIESINRTEACVFYVLSQLSHGEKPSVYLFSHFDAILVCLLNYLKNAKNRNPRALRILNRLTKNQYCFQNFVLSQFPYKIKSIFYNEATQTAAAACNNNNNDKEERIEREMNIYLNSNKVFFDEQMFFPSFESIDFTLCNNLKSHCISSSDHGYFCLTSMMKYPQKREERVSCVLVAPFILRNTRALQNIMIQLNGLDLVMDLLFQTEINSSTTTTSEYFTGGDEEAAAAAAASASGASSKGQTSKNKAILCIKRILNFVNYKRDLKQINDNLEAVKLKYYDSFKQDHHSNSAASGTGNSSSSSLVQFSLEEKVLYAKRDLLVKKSDYFNAMLNGSFIESSHTIQEIKLKEVSYQAFSIILDLLKCRHDDSAAAPTVDPQNNTMPITMPNLYSNFLNSCMNNYEINFDLCFNIIMACDRFMINDLKEMFISILCNKFFSFSNWTSCFQLAWKLDSILLSNALIDYLLSKIHVTLWNVNNVRTATVTSTTSTTTEQQNEISSKPPNKTDSKTQKDDDDKFVLDVDDDDDDDDDDNRDKNGDDDDDDNENAMEEEPEVDSADYSATAAAESNQQQQKQPILSENIELLKCSQFIDSILVDLNRYSSTSPSSIESSPSRFQLVDIFRKNLKFALSEIIKNNAWKFDELK